MNKKRLISFVVPILIVFTMLIIPTIKKVYAESTYTFQYPVNWDSEEWADLSTPEKITQLQIPDDILVMMTTDELLDAVLRYPLLVNIFAYDSYLIGVKTVSEQFNGLKELLNRDDIAVSLLQRYEGVDYSLLKDLFDNEETQTLMGEWVVELLLSQELVQAKMNNQQLDSFNETLISKAKEIDGMDDGYGLLTYYSASVKEIHELKGTSLPNENRSSIEGLVPYATTTTVKTPKGSSVSVLIRGEELNATTKANNKTAALNAYPGASFVAESTTKYNCHSHAWYSTNHLTNLYWMNDPTKYWSDGSYGITTAQTNAKITYATTAHSGVMVNSTTVLSKWGVLPLMRHSIQDCPYWAAPVVIRYYK